MKDVCILYYVGWATKIELKGVGRKVFDVAVYGMWISSEFWYFFTHVCTTNTAAITHSRLCMHNLCLSLSLLPFLTIKCLATHRKAICKRSRGCNRNICIKFWWAGKIYTFRLWLQIAISIFTENLIFDLWCCITLSKAINSNLCITLLVSSIFIEMNRKCIETIGYYILER